MDHQRRVQVVLGEAERTDGLLRFVLEAEGFDLVGLASNDEELSRVLRGARPAVVVLDGGISAVAALDARKSSGGAALVVVWPDGVSSVLAEERVEPNMAIEDLGNAVRRAAERAQQRTPPIRVPEAELAPISLSEIVAEDRLEHPTPARRRGRRAQLVVATATWLLIITALTAIASAVPNVVDLFSEPERRREPPAVAPPVERRADGRESVSEPTEEAARCDDATPGSGTDRSEGRGNGGPARGQGCASGRQDRGSAASGGGRPNDPGSQADGSGSSGGSPANGVSPGGAAQTGGDGDVEPGSGGAGGEHGNPGGGGGGAEHGNGGGGGNQQEHPHSGESAGQNKIG